MQAFRTIAAHTIFGTVIGLLIGFILTLIAAPFTNNQNILALAFYAPIFLCQVYFAVQAADQLQEQEFTLGYIAHHQGE